MREVPKALAWYPYSLWLNVLPCQVWIYTCHIPLLPSTPKSSQQGWLARLPLKITVTSCHPLPNMSDQTGLLHPVQRESIHFSHFLPTSCLLSLLSEASVQKAFSILSVVWSWYFCLSVFDHSQYCSQKCLGLFFLELMKLQQSLSLSWPPESSYKACCRHSFSK